MTRSEAEQREERRISQLAAQFRREGFEVLSRPDDEELPPFLKGLKPDLVVSKGDRNIIMEVRSRESLPQDEQLTELAAAIKGRGGWEFELVLTNPKESREEGQEVVTSPYIADRWLKQAEELTQSHREAGFMLAWMAFEAATQSLVTDHLKAPTRKAPRNLPKTAFSLGFVNRRQLKTLEKSQKLRNLLVHGVFVYVDDEDIRDFVEVVRELVDEAIGDG